MSRYRMTLQRQVALLVLLAVVGLVATGLSQLGPRSSAQEGLGVDVSANPPLPGLMARGSPSSEVSGVGSGNTSRPVAVQNSDEGGQHQGTSLFLSCPRNSSSCFPAIDSVVLMTFDVIHGRESATVEEQLRIVSDAFASPTTCLVANGSLATMCSAYYSFFQTASAALWVSEPNDAHRHRALQPLTVDVVYTYVDAALPFFPPGRERAEASGSPPHAARPSKARTRSWDELKYSLRTVYSYGMGSVAFTSAGPGATTQGGRSRRPLLGRVFLVVTDMVQVPRWLNVSFPGIFVVTHDQLRLRDCVRRQCGSRCTRATAEGSRSSLEHPNPGNSDCAARCDVASMEPLLNSFAIETLLHLIPGLSRFFVYFNNDMLWGRPVSVFDYFRPLSPDRQRLYHARHAALVRAVRSEVGDVRDGARTSVLFMEPRLRAGEWNPHHVRLVRRTAEPSAWLAELPTANPGGTFRRESVPWRTTTRYRLRKPRRRLDPTKAVLFANRATIVDHLDGVLPSLDFAHLPLMADRLVFQRLVDVDLAEAVAETRSHAVRHTTDLWVTYVYAFYALAHRRTIDREAVMLTGQWRRPTKCRRYAAMGPFYGDPYQRLQQSNWQRRDWAPPNISGQRSKSLGSYVAAWWQRLSRLLRTRQRWNEEALHFDMEAMVFSPDYHFHMLDSPRKALITAARLQTAKPFSVTLNDNYKAQLSDLEERQLRVATRIVLETVCRGLSTAPWELPLV